MRRLLLVGLALALTFGLASAENEVVFGPLEGDNAGVITVFNGSEIDIEIWVRTDVDIPVPFVGVNHALMSEDQVIAERNGATFGPLFVDPMWDENFVDGPYTHDPNDNYPIPEGNTSECMVALYQVLGDPEGDPLDTGGDWVYFGDFQAVCANDMAEGEYEPFAAGWYPHSNQGTSWAYETPPGGSVVPVQDYAVVMVETGIEDDGALPIEFSLRQNYPNPFNASTTIKFSLPEAGDVRIEIFDILGRHIETLVSGNQQAGEHSVVWNANSQPSGVYFYRIQAGSFSDQKSCLLLK